MHVGFTFHDNPSFNRRHLWVIVSIAPNGKLVAFNITSHRDGIDESCVLNRSDHPWLKVKSVIAYQKGQLWDPVELQRALDSQIYQKNEVASEELVRRIAEGALASPRTKGELKDILIERGTKRPYAVQTKKCSPA